MIINEFYDLIAWKKAHVQAIRVYEIAKSFLRDELYGVVSQLRRAASSVGANVAEGFGRYHFKDKIRFYFQARGSVTEVQNFILLSRDLGYITKETCNELFASSAEVKKLINGCITSIQKKI